MANEEHLKILKEGVETWNQWRSERGQQFPDLRGVNLSGANLSGANLHQADLSEADLSEADLGGATLSKVYLRKASLRGANLHEVNLSEADLGWADLSRAKLSWANLSGAYLRRSNLSAADLSGAKLSWANLYGADLTLALLNKANLSKSSLCKADLRWASLRGADLSGADFRGADLSEANLRGADLRGADISSADLSGANLSRANLSLAILRGANLEKAVLVETTFEQSILTNCRIYGISTRNVKLDDKTEQKDLIITPSGQPLITVDNLEVAQFIYLLLSNENIRHFIETITPKVVLILGRFTEERKTVLNAIRDELRRIDLTPVLFDFVEPASKDVTGTVEALARMARFIIADLTFPGSIPHELATIVPFLQTTPVLPLRLMGTGGYSMVEDLRKYPWFLDIHEYNNSRSLISHLRAVIVPANEMAKKLRKQG